MPLIKDPTTDRSKIPDLAETQLIQLDVTDLQKIQTKVVSVISALAAAALATVGLTQNDITGQSKGLVLLAAGVLAATGVLAWAIVSAADIRARGQATAANLALRQLPALTTVSAPAGAPGGSAGLWVHVAGRESLDKHLVINTQAAAGGKTEFLLARNDETPSWHSIDQLDGWEVKLPAVATS